MAVNAPIAVEPPADAEAGDGAEGKWPSRPVAWYAIFVFAIALMFAELDRNVFNLMAEMVKVDFGLSDMAMSLLMGPAVIIFYALVGVPMARLVDLYPRNIVLSVGIVVWSGMTAVTGLAQQYWQLIICRVLVGAGGTVHGPGTYSMMADYFPPRKLPRAIAGLQVGFILGNGLAFILGGAVIAWVTPWPDTEFAGLSIRNWQMVLLMVGLPGLLVATLVRTLPEPTRKGRVSQGSLPVGDVLREMGKRKGVYIPMFVALGFSATETFGIRAWQAPFMQRTYGWTPAEVGYWGGTALLISWPLGILLGTLATEWIGKWKRDAPVRVSFLAILTGAPFIVAAPLMPTGELAIIVYACGSMFGFAGAVPQNVAIQTVTPSDMRGTVTALYLMVFTVFGGLGATVIAAVTQYGLGDESKLWLSITITASVLLPIAALIMSRAMKPYAREIEKLEARGLY